VQLGAVLVHNELPGGARVRAQHDAALEDYAANRRARFAKRGQRAESRKRCQLLIAQRQRVVKAALARLERIRIVHEFDWRGHRRLVAPAAGKRVAK